MLVSGIITINVTTTEQVLDYVVAMWYVLARRDASTDISTFLQGYPEHWSHSHVRELVMMYQYEPLRDI